MVRCEYITVKGTECTRQAISGSNYCAQHLKIIKTSSKKGQNIASKKVVQKWVPKIKPCQSYLNILPTDLILPLLLFIDPKDLLDIVEALYNNTEVFRQQYILKSRELWLLYLKVHHLTNYNTILAWALDKKYSEIAEIILTSFNFDIKRAPIVAAAKRGYKDILSKLLDKFDKKADWSNYHGTYIKALKEAAYVGDKETVDLLLARGPKYYDEVMSAAAEGWSH